MTLYTGFDSSSYQSQATFKAILNATSEPGKLITLDNYNFTWDNLNAATVAILLTLCDHDSTVYLNQEYATQPNLKSLAFHTQAKTVPESHANFVVIHHQPTQQELDNLNLGTDLSPEESSTVIVQVDDFSEGNLLQLRGPGILHKREINLPLSETLHHYFKMQRNHFPKGADFIFTYENHLIAIPRSTSVEVI